MTRASGASQGDAGPDLGDTPPHARLRRLRARLYPDVEIEAPSLDEPVNLTTGEVDIAIGVVRDRKILPLNLHGLKRPQLFGGVYIFRDLHARYRAGAVDRIRWIVKNYRLPDWARAGEVAAAEVPFRTTHADAQITALRQGL